MLKVGCLISDFFQLILGVPPKLTPDAVNEGLRASEIFSKEGLELWPRDQSDALVVTLMLSPSEADRTTEK